MMLFGKFPFCTALTGPAGSSVTRPPVSGGGAHAPDEYYVIESANNKVPGFDGGVPSFVEYLYELEK